MNAAILTIGTELLMGTTVNTNSAYLSTQLNELGINVLYHVTVGDNPKRMREAFDTYFEKVDMIVTSGGLGPTQDDITKEVGCASLGVELSIHQDSLDRIESFFSRLGRAMTENNIRQAYLPVGGTVLENSRGTAPGAIVEKNGKTLVLLPGPPNELKTMFESGVKPYITQSNSHNITSRYLSIFGLGESSVESSLIDLITEQTDPSLATYAKTGEVMLRVTSSFGSEEENNARIDKVVERVRAVLGNHLYSVENDSIEEYTSRLLIEKGFTISTAESCTGGLIASKLTDVPGISAVFDRGFITYSNEAKMEELGVSEGILKAHGAVSSECAEAMARGLYEQTGSDFSVAVTGIAGPGGGSPEKPVGLVYVAVYHQGEVYIKELKLSGHRERIRIYSMKTAFDMVRRIIENKWNGN